METNRQGSHRDYIHCIACHCPLEKPTLKRIMSEFWYLDFGICDDCRQKMIKMKNPSIAAIIDGNTLKTLLVMADDQLMVASCFGDEQQ